jgi:rare lipoprotein A
MRTTIGLSVLLAVASSAALAKQAPSAHQQPMHSIKGKHTKASAISARNSAKRHAKPARAGHHASRHVRQHTEALPPADQYIGAVRVAGRRQIGAAAWYGGRHVGHRTASGEPLDTVRATAAHRSLPLLSLARVTNLNNGRSVIVKITDRGPVSRSLVIDLSPRAADVLDMKSAGIATVAIEPVVPAATPTADPAPHLAQR